MFNSDDYMDELNHWADQYEKAQADGVFDGAPKPPTPSSQTSNNSFFGLHQSNTSDDVSIPDAEYWNTVYDMSKDSPSSHPDVTGSGDKEELIQEDHSPKALKDSIKDHPMIRQALGQNPVKPSSVGEDQRRKVTPNWTDGEELQELESLKRSLYDLECKLSSEEGLLEDNKNVVKQLDALKKDLDNLSNSLSPQGWEDRES